MTTSEKLHAWRFRQRVEESGYFFDIYRCEECARIHAVNATGRPPASGCGRADEADIETALAP